MPYWHVHLWFIGPGSRRQSGCACVYKLGRPSSEIRQSEQRSAIRIHILANEHPLSREPWELQSNFSNKVFSLKTVDKSSHQARKKEKDCAPKENTQPTALFMEFLLSFLKRDSTEAYGSVYGNEKNGGWEMRLGK